MEADSKNDFGQMLAELLQLRRGRLSQYDDSKRYILVEAGQGRSADLSFSSSAEAVAFCRGLDEGFTLGAYSQAQTSGYFPRESLYGQLFIVNTRPTSSEAYRVVEGKAQAIHLSEAIINDLYPAEYLAKWRIKERNFHFDGLKAEQERSRNQGTLIWGVIGFVVLFFILRNFF